MSDNNPTRPQTSRPAGWISSLRVYLEPAALRMLALGFSAGLPLLLVLGTLSFRLREAGVDLATIGYLSWVGLAYAFKWAWAPLVDRLPLPLLTRLLGRRRSWLLLSQSAIAAGLVGMAWFDPQVDRTLVAACALAVAFASATQDIALDAFRIESAGVERQGALAATYQTGYRLAMIWAGAGVFWIAAHAEAPGASGYQHAAWRTAYLAMAASMAVGLLTVLFSPEPMRRELPPARSTGQWLRETVVEPFAEFLRRYGSHAVLVLALIAVYRISDVVMGIMANPFYADMGYTKAEVANITKVFGVVMTLAGTFLGGVLALRLGVMRVLMLGALLSAASNLLFAWLASRGHDVRSLVLVISADNLSSGIASAAFIAYLSGLTNVNYSATQYALFSSMMLLLPKWLAGFSGSYVEHFGYTHFFTATAALGVPVLLLVWLASRMQAVRQPEPAAA
ncbi:MFS transporter [Ramlibacter tataouinensis]|uniref:AmpG family muropeptide MFS transporter n=1 Tax=Ramlibacter tataouinensis TaxID=94132 RepID=UPI0022F3CC81|nr:MFS transporter [Ramlibacter tataouinensis]WBY03997.1 MFS transporter [Ramlibacter tataouinensis]